MKRAIGVSAIVAGAVLTAAAVSAAPAELEEPVADQVRAHVARLADLQRGEARSRVVEAVVALGDRAKPSLRDIARTTKDSRAVLDVAEVASRLGMVDVADIYVKRLLATDPQPLPGYLGLAVVDVMGEAEGYPRLADLALAHSGEVRRRIVDAIGYSAVGSHNPLPTLNALASRLSGDERVLAYDQMLSALHNRGAYIVDPAREPEPELRDAFKHRLLETADVQAIAKMILDWIVRDQRFDGSRPGEEKGRCPYPADGRPLAPPFGVVFDKPSGGYRSLMLAGARVAEVDQKTLKSSLHVEVKRHGEFASVSFFDLIADEQTRVTVLLRKGPAGWAYGGHMRTDRCLVDFF